MHGQPAYLFVETAHLLHRLLHMLKVGGVFERPIAFVNQLELACCTAFQNAVFADDGVLAVAAQ